MAITDDFYLTVADRLDRLEIGRRINLDVKNFPSASDLYRYIEAAKRYIDEYPKGQYCPIEFSNHYEFLIKKNIFEKPNENN